MKNLDISEKMEDLLQILTSYNYWVSRPDYDLGYTREFYLDKIKKLIGNRLIKVIIGQRRTGKSYVMRQIIDYLINEQKVNPKNVFYLNKEIYEFDRLRSADDLNQIIKLYRQRYSPAGKVYLFIDEIQTIDNWEKLIVSLAQDTTKDYEIFISGSNSSLLSGELATFLSGRYIVFEIFPLSYSEYLEFKNLEPGKETFIEYIRTSAMPEMLNLPSDEARLFYFQALKDTVLMRDIISRHKVRDARLLEDIFLYLVHNVGNLISVQNIVKYYKSKGKSVDYGTVSNYLGYLEQAMIIHSVRRQNIKTKELLGGQQKYYLTDLGFRNILFPSLINDFGSSLENIFYIHLRRLGYQVYVGDTSKYEIDFVAQDRDRKMYFQISYLLSDKAVIEREFRPLEAIKDAFPKYVLTMDDLTIAHPLGIKHAKIWEMLLQNEF